MIIALAGRRIDAPGAEELRFPLQRVEMVKQKLRTYFEYRQPSALVCSGACGADLLALDVAGELGIQRHLVLPFPYADFVERSVADCLGDWTPLFDRIYKELAALETVIVLHYTSADKEAYQKTNIEILNKAESLLTANGASGHDPVVALLVWEGKIKAHSDTTAHFAEEAKKRNISINEIII